MNILFICQHNVFRSQIAEWYFNELNEKPRNICYSGGIFPGIQIPKGVLEGAKKNGIEIKGVPKSITTKLLRLTDLIIIVAELPNSIISKNIFKGKIENWNITDYPDKDRDEIINEIKKKVENLITRL